MKAPLEAIRAVNLAVDALDGGDAAPLREWINSHLFGHILPFWEKHAFDPAGGISTCIGDGGQILSRDKWLWSQWRAVWVYSRLFNRVDANPHWLARARSVYEFTIRTGWLPEARGWALLVSGEGEVLRGHESIYADAFAIYGLLEYHRATGEAKPLELARQTADAVLERLQTAPWDTLPHFPYPIPPGARQHGVPMIFSLKFAELGAYLNEPRYLEAAAAMQDEIFSRFYRSEWDLVVERVGEDGGIYPGAAGTAVVPGHVIEDLWFQIHVGRLLQRPLAAEEEMCRLMLRHYDIGWDPQAPGGLRLAVDALDGPEIGWAFADSKLWWPHTEALYAFLLGWKLTGKPRFLEAYREVWAFCLTHFVDWENGEWRQKLGRDAKPLADVVALPVKDPFHLPRALILQLELLGADGLRP